MHEQRNEFSHCILCCRAWGAECTRASLLAPYQHSYMISSGQICSMASQLPMCVQRNDKVTFRSHANILWLAQVQNVRSSCIKTSASVVYQCSARQLYGVVQKLTATVQCSAIVRFRNATAGCSTTVQEQSLLSGRSASGLLSSSCSLEELLQGLLSLLRSA